MRILLLAFPCVLVAQAPTVWQQYAHLAAQAPTVWQQYADPADAGFDAIALSAVGEQAEALGSAAVFVVHRGHVLSAFGEVELALPCHSVRKSLISALVGIQVAAGEIDTAATLEQLGIDDVPPLTAAERAATVFDLLRSRSGIYHPAAKEPRDMKTSRPARGSHRPGEHFWYNNWDFNTVATVFARATGSDVFAAFARDLATPLGMEDFRATDAQFELEPSSSLHPAYDFRLSARDLARIGWLFACDGSWGDARIVPADWVAESTKVHSQQSGGNGYGLMWWSYPAGAFEGNEQLDALDRERKFAAIGTGGQLLLVLPDAQLVFVHRVSTDTGPGVRGGDVWRLAEAVLDARSGTAVAEPRLMPLSPTRFEPRLVLPPLPDAVPLPAAALAELVGEYGGDGPRGLRLTLHLHDGRLFGLAHGQGEVEMFCSEKDHFFAKAEWSLRAVVHRDDAGKIASVTVSLQGRSMELSRR